MKVTRSALCRLLWAAAIACVIVGSLLPGDSRILAKAMQIAGNDKAAHFVAYTMLGVLAMFSFQRRIQAMPAAASMVLLGGLLELAQKYAPGRSPEVADEVANLLGVACGVLLAILARAIMVRSPDEASG